ncbi:MAG: GxxExxY protein [Prevotella sp.]|nr:GxxExxY protein [Prevotella sp.]MDO4933876.1 GxxExxY protein [Prevotella sp.]
MEDRAQRINAWSKVVIGAAIEVHKCLGPGLLESIYEDCLKMELEQRGLHVETQVNVPVIYKGVDTKKHFRLDMLIEDEIVVELKAVDVLLPVHEVQLVTYLKLTDKRLGLLINFNVPILKDGIKRRVNGLYEYTGIKPIRD